MVTGQPVRKAKKMHTRLATLPSRQRPRSTGEAAAAKEEVLHADGIFLATTHLIQDGRGGRCELGGPFLRRDGWLLLAKLLLQAVERVCNALLLDQVDDSGDGSDEEEHANHRARNRPCVA